MMVVLLYCYMRMINYFKKLAGIAFAVVYNIPEKNSLFWMANSATVQKFLNNLPSKHYLRFMKRGKQCNFLPSFYIIAEEFLFWIHKCSKYHLQLDRPYLDTIWITLELQPCMLATRQERYVWHAFISNLFWGVNLITYFFHNNPVHVPRYWKQVRG